MQTVDKTCEEAQIAGDNQVTSNSQGPQISTFNNETLNDASCIYPQDRDTRWRRKAQEET